MNKQLFILFSLLIFISCEKQETANDKIVEPDWVTKSFNFQHDGLTRSYIIHKPKNFVENSPL